MRNLGRKLGLLGFRIWRCDLELGTGRDGRSRAISMIGGRFIWRAKVRLNVGGGD